jgi:hypothetical protein
MQDPEYLGKVRAQANLGTSTGITMMPRTMQKSRGGRPRQHQVEAVPNGGMIDGIAC